MPAVGPSELEAALIIRSDAPRRLAEQISALTSIAGYRLHHEPPQPIRDLYFDTRERALAAKRVALRVRTIGQLHLLTVKGPSRRTEWGAAERLELEQPWSVEALDKTVATLRRAGVTLPRAANPTAAPIEVLRALGLDVVQDRETQRQPRSVTRPDDPRGTALAELAVDAVTYHFETKIVRMYEIEIEAKSAGGASAVRAIMDRLGAQFAPTLQPWPYGKLATGQTIERLLREGAFDGLLGADQTLSPAALERIEAVLTQEGP